MLTIDGSRGEGGGQMLRTALGLSLVTGTPFRIVHIRARRRNPGLRAQHATAVRAAAEIGAAEVAGATLGSRELLFRPTRVAPGSYAFAAGTAGSAMLVLQTVLPALLTASGPTSLTLEGGTHNPWAPPFDFLAKTFVPILGRMGPRISMALERRGFYPAGGGRVTVAIDPVAKLRPIDLVERGAIRAMRARAIVVSLPVDIARREMAVVQRGLDIDPDSLEVEEDRHAHGPGNVLMIEVESDSITELFAGFGQRGVRAGTIAERTVRDARQYLDADVPVGPYLADQLLVPMALAGGGSFVTLPPTGHTTTNMDVIGMFLDHRIQARPLTDGRWQFRI